MMTRSSDALLRPNRRTVLAGSAAALALASTPRAFAKGFPVRVPGNAPVRRDGPLKVRGAPRFAAEHSFPGMVYAALVHSTIPKGTIRALDTAAAEAAPGVELVMTHENAPSMNAPEAFFGSKTGVAGSALPVMQDASVHWNGQVVALVLAGTQEQADHAASLIGIEYDPAEAVTSFDAATADATLAANLGREMRHVAGDAEAALAEAPVSVDTTFTSPPHTHNQIEPHAVTVRWEGTRLRMHDCSQGITMSALTMAKVFDLDPADVRVSAEFIGGGFGGKTLWSYHILAAAASRMADRPVRMALSRNAVSRLCGGRAPVRQRLALGAGPDGRLTALIHTGTTVKTASNAMTEPFIDGTRHMYRADAMHLEARVGVMDMLANSFMRAPGSAVGSVALETAMDELAEKLRMDPVDLRIRNEPEVDPTTGTPFSQRALVDAYREGARRFGWVPRAGRRLGREDGEWLVGTGMAAAYYPYKRFPGGAARITLRADGTALAELAGHDMGMGTATATATVAAERLGLAYADIEVRHGDSSLPGSLLAGASQQTAAIGASLTAAGDALVTGLTALLREGDPLYGATPADLTLTGGTLALATDPARRIALTDLVARSEGASISAEAKAPPPTEAKEWSMHSTGAVFAEARVNAVTGELRVSRITGVYDCGRILNATLAESQFKGGIVMSLGLALMEAAHLDERTGRTMNPGLAGYYVPTHLDVPEIDIAWTGIPDPQAPSGARGIGEVSMNGASAAVINAVYDATGKRIRDLPLTPDKLL